MTVEERLLRLEALVYDLGLGTTEPGSKLRGQVLVTLLDEFDRRYGAAAAELVAETEEST